MMLSSEEFAKMHEYDDYMDLIKTRDDLIRKIRRFEKRKCTELEWKINPRADVVYQMNLEYLSKICELTERSFSLFDSQQRFKVGNVNYGYIKD